MNGPPALFALTEAASNVGCSAAATAPGVCASRPGPARNARASTKNRAEKDRSFAMAFRHYVVRPIVVNRPLFDTGSDEWVRDAVGPAVSPASDAPRYR